MLDLSIIFECTEFAALPRVLCQAGDDSETKKTAMTIEEILVANLGDTHPEPHLLVHPI